MSEVKRPTALVTGARRGIGAAIAENLASAGFDVAITDIDLSDTSEVVQAVERHGRRVMLVASNLAHVKEHARVVQEVVTWGGPIACLVNNAGVSCLQRGDLLDIKASAYDAVLDVNLKGTFFFTQAVARHMLNAHLDHPRSIITISSVSVEMASIERGEYCLSKSGLNMLTKLFALRLAPVGISVFELRPGIIRTPMTEGVAVKYDERIAGGLVPMGRWGHPSDVANVVAMLAAGKMAFSTGSVIQVDGALSIPKL